MSRPPLVLLHGLWDTPRLFDRLQRQLQERLAREPEHEPLEVFAPHLPHGLGEVPLRQLAAQLAHLLQQRYGAETPLDLLGFSMGGLIGRLWLQEHGGHRRTRRFFCLGSPQQGTLAAQWVPRRLLAGIADMKLGSDLIRQLDREAHLLLQVHCHSLYSVTDTTVVPGWRAVLPQGSREALPVFTHRQLIAQPRALARLTDLLLAP